MLVSDKYILFITTQLQLVYWKSSVPAGVSSEPWGVMSVEDHACDTSASLLCSSSCHMMELESGTFSASGIPEPVTATLAGPGS